MTFSEIKDLLMWARANRVAQIEAGAVKATFYPDKDASTVKLPDFAPHDTQARIDYEMFGGPLDRDLEAQP